MSHSRSHRWLSRRSGSREGRGASVREKMKSRMLLLVLLMAGMTATLTGCGSTNGFLLQSPQTYTLTVTATSATLAHSQTITLIVQ